ncbi:MAG: hypothetical protein AB7E49_03055 [Campylobacterales bacterium]
MSRREVITLGAQYAELEFYRLQRYGAPFSLILVCFEGQVPPTLEEALDGRIRKTDAVEMLTECTLLIILGHTGRGEAGLALKHLDPLFKGCNKPYHIATATAGNDDQSATDVLSRAIDEMGDYARCLEC